MGSVSTGTTRSRCPSPSPLAPTSSSPGPTRTALFELSEFNNNRAATVGTGPDLVVTTLTAPATAPPGGTLMVTDTTANQGPSPAPASSTRYPVGKCDARRERYTAPEQGRRRTGRRDATGTATLTLPAVIPAGSYYLLAQADGDGAIEELSEIDNTRGGNRQGGAGPHGLGVHGAGARRGRVALFPSLTRSATAGPRPPAHR